MNFLSNLLGRSAMLPAIGGTAEMTEEQKRAMQGSPALPSIGREPNTYAPVQTLGGTEGGYEFPAAVPRPPMTISDYSALPTIDDPALKGLPPSVTAEKQPLGTVADLSLPAIEPLPAPAVTAAAQATPAASAVPSLPAIEPAIEQSPRKVLEGQLGALDQKAYNKGVYRNPLTGETTNNPKKEGFTEVVTAPGKDRDKNWSTWDKIASALVGWAGGGLAGGIKAGTDRNFFEKMGDANERARLLPKIEAAREGETHQANQDYRKAQADYATARPEIERAKLENRVALEKEKFNNRTKILEIQAKNEGGKWKPYVDEDGRRWKQFPNDPTKELEPIVDPLTGQQDIDPSGKLYDWVDPTSGQTVKIKGSQLANAGAQIASGNATREQQAATTNASNAIRVMTENVNNQMQYQGQVASLMNQALAADPGLAGDMAVTGLRSEFEAKQRELDSLRLSPPPEYDEAAARAYASRVNKLTDDLTSTAQKLWAEVGKTEAGRARAAQAQDAIRKLKPPPKVAYEPIKASRVGGRYAGQVFPSPQALQQAFPGRSVADIKALVEAQGGRFQ